MLNVLIIDDEPNVRLGLRKIVPWEENGFQVCGEGQNAEDGFEKIMTLSPDIVLIDIKLPGKLGTDVIKEAREAGFAGKFIIISGYSNFEYAKTGIKYGVKSYILKPVDEDELMDLLLELKIEIENEKQWQQEKKMVQYTKLQNFILDENEEGFEEDDQLEEQYSKYENFRIALILDVDSHGKKAKLEQLVKEQLKSYGDVDVIKIDTGILILFKDFNSRRIDSISGELKKKLDKILNENIFITLGCEVDNIRKIKESYKEAKRLFAKKFLFLEKGIISNESLYKIDTSKALNFDTIIEKIYSYVEISDDEKIIEEFKELEKLIIQRNYSEEQIKVMCIKVFLDLKQKLNNDYDPNEIKIKADEEIIENIYSKISLKNIIDYLIENFNNIAKQIGGTSSENIIKRVINYMNTNYYKDLKLEALAEIFSYNSAYLGKLFKSNIGESFNTYLDKIRIEKAKYLLVEEKLKIYQVCERVGYKNIDYFYSKFKKYVGTSPSSYKKQCDEESAINIFNIHI